MKTTIQELINEFDIIKTSKFIRPPEVIFFNGLLSIIEAKYLKLEKQQMIDFHVEVLRFGLIEEGEKKWKDVYEPKVREVAEQIFDKIYKPETP